MKAARHRSPWRLFAGVGTFVLLAPAWSQAGPIVVDGEPIAPLVPSFTPRQPVEIANRFHEALAEGARGSAWSPLDPAEVRRKSGPGREPLGCAEQICIRASQKKLQADYALVGQIEIVGKNYTIEVSLHDRDRKLARVTGRCDICTLKEALDRTEELARKAARQASARVTTRAKPSPGQTTSEPSAPLNDGQRKSKAGLTEKQAKSPQPSVRDESSGWPLWPALAAAGLAAVGLGAGIPLLTIDGEGTSCRGQAREDQHNCERIYTTAGGGWVLTSFGLASAAAAGVLLYLHLAGRDEERPAISRLVQQVGVVPSAGGVVFGAGGTF